MFSSSLIYSGQNAVWNCVKLCTTFGVYFSFDNTVRNHIAICVEKHMK